MVWVVVVVVITIVIVFVAVVVVTVTGFGRCCFFVVVFLVVFSCFLLFLADFVSFSRAPVVLYFPSHHTPLHALFHTLILTPSSTHYVRLIPIPLHTLFSH